MTQTGTIFHRLPRLPASLLHRLALVAALTGLAVLGACASTRHASESDAKSLVQHAGRKWEVLQGNGFSMVAVPPVVARPNSYLTVYLEESVPTKPDRANPAGPGRTDALEMMLQENTAAHAYLARPCQYDEGRTPNCKAAYWGAARYAPEIVDAESAALDQLKAQSGATGLYLVGYLGGGAMAVLVAAERRDVVGIVTMGSELSLGYLAQHYRTGPVNQSLDPADVAPIVTRIPQVHFVAGRDTVVPIQVINNFMSRLPDRSHAITITINNYDHDCCWASDWQRLSSMSDLRSTVSGWNG